MQEAFEEYGGALATCIVAVIIITFIYAIFTGEPGTTGSTFRDIIIQFFTSIGGSVV